MLRTITTVTSANSNQDLVTLALVKEELGITATTDDVWLQHVITRASKRLAGECNRIFVLETIKDEIWPQRDPGRGPRPIPGGLDVVQISRFPLAASPTVLEDGVTLTENTDFRTDARRGQLIRLGLDGYPTRWRVLPLAITVQTGFSPIPDDLADAALSLVKSRWFSRKRDPNLRSETIDGVRSASWWVATDSSLPPDVVDTIGNYRVPVIA